jgi:hypothetical protein
MRQIRTTACCHAFNLGDVLIVEGLALKPLQVLKILAGGRITNLQPRIDPAATLPDQEPDRTAEAIRRVLPELVKLDRYERRASSRRHKAVVAFIAGTRNVEKQLIVVMAPFRAPKVFGWQRVPQMGAPPAARGIARPPRDFAAAAHTT